MQYVGAAAVLEAIAILVLWRALHVPSRTAESFTELPHAQTAQFQIEHLGIGIIPQNTPSVTAQ